MKISRLRRSMDFEKEVKWEEVDRQRAEFYEKNGYSKSDNLYLELEMDSPYVNAHEDYSRTVDVVQLHSHTFHEILFCRSGNVQYMLGTERYRLQRGDVVVAPAGVSHQPLFLEKMVEPYRRYVVWVSKNFVDIFGPMCDNSLEMISGASLVRTAGTPWEKEMEGIFRKCCKEDLMQRPGYKAALCGEAMVLLVELSRAFASVQPVPQEKPELIDEVTAYIENHLEDKITLEQTARRFLVSKSTVSHLFSQKLGVSFYRWVTRRRLIAAKNLIQEGRTMEDVFEEVGFRDYTTFYKAFKKEYGISPSQYKGML